MESELLVVQAMLDDVAVFAPGEVADDQDANPPVRCETSCQVVNRVQHALGRLYLADNLLSLGECASLLSAAGNAKTKQDLGHQRAALGSRYGLRSSGPQIVNS